MHKHLLLCLCVHVRPLSHMPWVNIVKFRVIIMMSLFFLLAVSSEVNNDPVLAFGKKFDHS